MEKIIDELSTIKYVKGQLNTGYTKWPNAGETFAGGKVEYQFIVNNKGKDTIGYFEAIDILPHIGDKGVILNKNSRGSQFPIYMTGEMEIIVEASDEKAVFITEYSNSYDPVRFSEDGKTIIGTVDDWTKVVPDDFTKVKAFKVTCTNIKVLPKQEFIVSFTATVPVGTPIGLTSSNSVAILAKYYDANGALTPYPTIEPNEGVIKIGEGAETVTLGGCVWNDVFKNGLKDSGEPKIDNVKVDLFDSTGTTLLQSTVTTKNFNGVAGYYAFGNLAKDCYIVRFNVPKGYIITAENVGKDMSKNSRANQKTGLTSQICLLTAGEKNMNINAGLIFVITRCQAVTDLIESVALEQTSLSHILNAEGEKLQAAIKLENITQPQLVSVNYSIKNMVNSISRLEMILQDKLSIVKECSCTCAEEKVYQEK